MPTAALRRFVDDELMRAPMVIDLTVKAVFEALQVGPAIAGAAERQVAADVILRLGAYRALVAAGYVKSLRQQADAEFAGRKEPLSLATHHPAAPGPRGLSLVDDGDVAVDVAMSHAIETIKSVAESEIRELISYTSALANDMDVGRDHNPLRPETQARALWFAAQALPLSREHQLAFMRLASTPFAQALRKAYAAASARLEEQGVEPAAYRTLIMPRGPRRDPRSIGEPSYLPYAQRELNERADIATPYTSVTLRPPSPPQPPPAAAADTGAEAISAPGVTRRPSSASNEAMRLAGQVDELFETIISDRRLPVELQAPMLRLQSCAMKVAVLDPTLLDRHTHPLWRFADLVAHEAVVHPGPGGAAREVMLRFVGKVLDTLVQETRQGEPLYVWAIERMSRFAAKRLAEQLTVHAARVTELQSFEDRIAADAPLSTLQGTVDLDQLETVPSALLDGDLQSDPPDRAMTSARWLLERRSGDWLRVFRNGHWAYAQLLWPGDRGELSLFLDGETDACWAIRRSALLAMRDSKIVSMAWPRSLVADATAYLLRRRSRDSAAR
jgi:Protein of unknown function (DUF1631)